MGSFFSPHKILTQFTVQESLTSEIKTQDGRRADGEAKAKPRFGLLEQNQGIILLFLLKDERGRGLLIAEAASKNQANAFGCSHLPEFCGDAVEIDASSRVQAEEFWGVRTVRVVNLQLTPKPRAKTAVAVADRTQAFKTVWVRGPELPEEVVEADLLTPEDYRDLTLDHIARECAIVVKVEIFKRG